MFDNQLNGNGNHFHIYQVQIVINPQPEKKSEPEKEKKSLMDRLKPLLGFGGAVADFIKKILPIILLAFGIQS
ncbi:MAG: hypothetical protein EOO10_18555 [Chitinophagaceae bacterium]|nr:MAG: hypothetical protein EOO10_18555 [Chitinophagaceae bacterium]